MENLPENQNNTLAEPSKQTGNKPVGSGDEKAPDSSDNGVQKIKANKGKKRYVRYLNDRRETVRAANPNLPFAEITKILASEWSSLPVEKKQQYLDAAEQDRERYTREFNAYKQTDAYKVFTQQQTEKKLKETKEDVKPHIQLQPNIIKESQQTNNDVELTNCDIPIFTEEFLDHNKSRDAELRQLRKSNTDYEQQNAILQKHIENMKSAIEKLENEIIQQRKTNSSLQNHLDHLRTTLASGFAPIKLPGSEEVASIQTIDNYMSNLHKLLLDNNSQDTNLLRSVRDIAGRLEFNG